jgi:pimeloyl-ACP methyl ester carboxylesterase
VSAPALVRAAPLAHLRWDAPGPPVVLLHGVGGGRESWGDAISRTGRGVAAAGFTAIAVDLPGYGDSPLIDPYDMAGLARAVRDLIDWLGTGTAAVVGHSMGGMVALEMMAHAPQGVAALVLMGTTPAFGRPDGEWQRQFLAQRLAPLDAGKGMSSLAPGLVQGMASRRAPHDAVARGAVLMSAVPEATYRLALAAIAGFDRRKLLSQLRLPVLCLAGADDRNAPPSVMEKMALCIGGAEYRVLPGVGHLAHMEAPRAVNPALVGFLQRHLH